MFILEEKQGRSIQSVRMTYTQKHVDTHTLTGPCTQQACSLSPMSSIKTNRKDSLGLARDEAAHPCPPWKAWGEGRLQDLPAQRTTADTAPTAPPDPQRGLLQPSRGPGMLPGLWSPGAEQGPQWRISDALQGLAGKLVGRPLNGKCFLSRL